MLKNACKASVEKLRQPLSLERTLLKALLFFRFVPEFFLNPLHLNISMYILHTVKGLRVWRTAKVDSKHFANRVLASIHNFVFYVL